MHVPIIGPLNYGGTILAVDEAKGSYQVKSDRDGLVDWVKATNLRYSCVGAEARPVSDNFFFGKWDLFVGPTPHYETKGSDRYLVVGAGAKAPPLLINPDGTYVWRIDSKKTITGKWRKMAESERKYHAKGPAVLLMNAEDGKNWEVSQRGVNPTNNRDTINVERMDLGLSYQGTRMP